MLVSCSLQIRSSLVLEGLHEYMKPYIWLLGRTHTVAILCKQAAFYVTPRSIFSVPLLHELQSNIAISISEEKKAKLKETSVYFVDG